MTRKLKQAVKKIVLIRPRNKLKRYSYPPMSFLSLGSVLEKEYQVKIIDVMLEKDYKKTILNECRDALLVGITAMTSEVPNGIEISDMIKEKYPELSIVWGGTHPTFLPKQTVVDKSVDFVIIEEGEYSLLRLAKSLKNSEKIIREKSFIDLEKLPPIAYHLVDVEKYVMKTHPKDGSRVRWLPYQSSRGCPHRCTFCHNSILKRGYRTKSTKKVLDEIENMIKTYNIQYFSFLDDNFFVDIKRVEKICKGIIKRKMNVKWFAECRADYFGNTVDNRMLRLLKKAGWVHSTIGAESGSPRMLKLLKKDITPDHMINAARMCKKYGVISKFSFIIGTPGETREDVKITLKLIKKLKEIDPDCIAPVNIFFLVPGCEIYNELVNRGMLEAPKTLRDWAKKDYQRMFIDGYTKDEYILNVGFYHMLTSKYNRKQINTTIKRFRIWLYPFLFFIFLAKFRCKYNLYRIPIDKHIYSFMSDVYLKIRSVKRSF